MPTPKKPKSPSKPTKPSKPKKPRNVKDTTPPLYLTIKGYRYERMSKDSVDVELELKADVVDSLDGLVSAGKYVSRGDAIRSMLREMLKDTSGK